MSQTPDSDRCPDLDSKVEASGECLRNSLIDRRHALGTLGLTGMGAALFASLPTAASADEVALRLGGNDKLDVPEAWARKNRSAGAYHRYLNSLRLKSIDAAQVIDSHVKQRRGVWNVLPPRNTWKRMGYILKVVDRIAREMNVNEVEVISAYRSPAYNARCYGAKKGSWHQENVAVDVSFAKTRPSKVTRTARELRRLGLFNGGVGGYRRFTHVDARGYDADW